MAQKVATVASSPATVKSRPRISDLNTKTGDFKIQRSDMGNPPLPPPPAGPFCRQLFLGHVQGSGLMKRKGKKYRMIIKKNMQITKIGLNLRVELARQGRAFPTGYARLLLS